MQLILNTDSDIGIQKMTTIKQESIEEKFTNNSLIEKVCNDIKTSSNECLKNQELIVQVYESIKTDEHINQNINSETGLDDTNNGSYNQCDEGCDKEQKNDTENIILENEQCEEHTAIEDEKDMQYNENSDLRSKSDTLYEGDVMVQPNEIEISETKIKQQDIMKTEKNEEDDPSKEETKMEEKIDDSLKINTNIENCVREQNKKDTEIKMEVGEQYTVQGEMEDKIEESHNEVTSIEDKFEEKNGLNTKIEEKIDERYGVDTKIGGKTEDQDEVIVKIEDKVETQNEVNTNVENKIEEKHELETEKQDLNTIQDEMRESEINENFVVKDQEDIEIVKKTDEQRKETINMSIVDEFHITNKLLDKVQESDKNKTEDKIEKQENVELDISVQDKPGNVKDCTEESHKKIDEIQDQRMYDKVDEVKIEEEKCKKNMEIEEDKYISKSKVNDDISSNIKDQLEYNDGIKENTKEQEPLKKTANYLTNVTTEQLDQVETHTDCDLDKMTYDEQPPKTSPKTEVHTEIKNNSVNDEIMDVDLEQSPDLLNSKESYKISSNNNSKATAPEAEVIDIADEKDEDFECIIDQEAHVIENKVEQTIHNKESVTINKDSASVLEFDVKENETTARTSELNSVEPVKFVQEEKEHDPESLHKAMEKSPEIEKSVEEKKKLTHICKLSNTLDILSDEDEESSKSDSQKDITDTTEKQCIQIEDDDDIMLIDEESNSKDSINNVENLTEPTNELENEKCKLNPKDKEEYSFNITITEDEAAEPALGKQSVNETVTSKMEDDKGVQEEKQLQQKPLMPVNFLKTCKKNLADMTRDELEEFCILKIVESVVDRSNLSEIKSQLKSLAQNIEEYRKKTSTLTKQNRDLQVVLKSVQEEQKKKSNLPITPLKITRSVGMQVLMTDKTSGTRKKTTHGSNTSQNNVITNSAPTRSGKGQGNQNSKFQKIQNSISPIPVPRLVPAANTGQLTNMKVQPPTVSAQGKSNSNTSVQVPPVPNGMAPSPTPKPEKRSHGQMQQNNSVTVDLTDDEPPAKVIQRNIAPPVRLVPPQNLLAANRQPFGTSINSPRKVYIPISGSQNHAVGVRPGQTIMLKTVSPQGQRQRCPTPAGKINQNVNSVRMQRCMPNRHPAPLPDSMKQYQPPNWKTLPPAPELNLSKVDNGIVISWKIEEYHEDEYEEIASYQLYAYQETSSPPSTALWKKIGDVKALPLPMACTLTQFMPGYKYYFAVRAVDVRSRLGPFSLPGSILLLNKI